MAVTAKRLSPGVYEVNGKRINASSSDAAIAAYNKSNKPASTTSSSPSSKWNENLSNELSALKKKPNPTQAEKDRIYALEDIKTGAGLKVSDPYPRPASNPAAPVDANPTPVNTPVAADPAPVAAPPVVAQPPPVAVPTPGTLPAPTNVETFPTTPVTQGSPNSSVINPNTPGLSPGDVAAIERLKAITGIGETYGRNIANEFYANGSLGRQAEVNTPEEIAALQRATEFAGNVGVQSDAVKQLLQQQQGILGNAQQLSPLELEALQVARNSLQGLNAPEMEALRSAARQNIQGQIQAGARDLAKSQARNQVFGSAATAQRNLLQQAGIREGRNLERDLLVKNIDIKQAAQNAFTGLTTNTEANRSSRTNAASGQLSNTTLQDEATRKSAQGSAINSQATIAGSLADRLRQLREFNLGQAAAEKAGQVGSIFSGIGAVSSGRGLLAGEEFTDKQYQDSQDLLPKLLELIKKGGSL